MDRAARILHELGAGSPSLGVTELGARLGLAKPTVHGLLRTLEACGLVRQDVATGRYSLGPGVLQLGNAYLAGSELRARSMLRAGALARQVNEAVWVSVLVDDAVMVVHHEFRPDDAVQILEVGATVPWHACALGHAIVAALPGAEADELLGHPLRALTGRTRTSPEALRKALTATVDRGFAVENQEANVGDGGIAAPVHDHSGRVVGSLGVVGPVERLLQRQARAHLSRAVMDTARAVSRELGASRTPLTGPPVTHAAPPRSRR
ncbi:MAG: IclR family transcriptional regulator [Actinomycetes bacterium]